MSSPRPGLCCTHQQPRIDSPEPPARLFSTLDAIFATAALPDDHPHALKLFCDGDSSGRRPSLPVGIMRSPGIADKIRLQFRRRASNKSLRKDPEYDSDVRPMTLHEALDEVAEEGPDHAAENSGSHRRFGNIEAGNQSESRGGADLRASVWSSLEWLRPLIQRPSRDTPSVHSVDVADVAIRVSASYELSGGLTNHLNSIFGQIRAISTPELNAFDPQLRISVQRSRSEVLHRALLNMGPSFQAEFLKSSKHCRASGAEDREISANAFIDADDHDCGTVGDLYQLAPIPGDRGCRTISTLVSEERLALRDPADELIREDSAASNRVCNHPASERAQATAIAADNGSSSGFMLNGDFSSASQPDDRPVCAFGQSPDCGSHHVHLKDMGIPQQLRSKSQLSSTADDEYRSLSPGLWSFHHREQKLFGAESSDERARPNPASEALLERVRSPAASSIYSRPSSPVAANTAFAAISPIRASEVVREADIVSANWPFKVSVSGRDPPVPAVTSKIADSRNKPLPRTPVGSRQDSGTASFVTANDLASAHQPAHSDDLLPAKSSSSTLTRTSKRSRFLNSLSPPKKAVQKRRSIFRFLRPGSRKDRSVTPPVTGDRELDVYDGSMSDDVSDTSLLTVQYELEEQPQKRNSRADSSNLAVVGPGMDSNYLTVNTCGVSGATERSPTFAEYERKLSVLGDDRRRPSMISLKRLDEVRENDRRQSIRRRLSRAGPLKSDADPLMASALEKHQQEKALFRSPSKQRESLGADLIQPSGSSPSAGRSVVGPDQDTSAALSKGKCPAYGHSTTASARAKVSGSEWSTRKPRKIGTSLASWSRYPSHTRALRSGSAGRADSVIARDFAIDIHPDDISDNGSHTQTAKSRAKRALHRNRSLSFGGIVRYYSNLFHAAGFTGQNRRTSVTIGGRVEHPELEMLPPAIPPDLPHSHYDPLGHIVEQLAEDVEDVKTAVKEGGERLGSFVRKEEADLENFVRGEELRLESFVRKEEDKLKDYIHDEHGKFSQRIHRAGQRASSPFREGVFASPARDVPSRREHRSDPGPSDEMEAGESALQLDGTQTEAGETVLMTSCSPSRQSGRLRMSDLPLGSPPSRAELWSDVYRECVGARPSSAEEPMAAATGTTSEKRLMKAVPNLDHRLSQATVRRFPSVTVVDDRQGHWRSVSLISVRSAGVERESTNDLLELMQRREWEERSKLLRAIR